MVAPASADIYVVRLPVRLTDGGSIDIFRNRNDWIVAFALKCSQIRNLNGSSFDPVAGRSYLGGTSLASAA